MFLTAAAPAHAGTIRLAHFPLYHGGALRDVDIGFQLSGNPDGPLVVVLGGISAGRAVSPGWWQDFVGPSRAVDTDTCCILGIDFLGGTGTTTGPRDAAFPPISTFDQADAVAAVLDALQLQSVHTFIGSSYGGMVALAFGASHPARVAKLLVISAAHEPHPMATALRSLQRRTVRLGLERGCADEALAIARGIAMTTYRTTAEFAQRFETGAHLRDGEFRHDVEDYLEHCGRQYAQRFSPWAFLCLSQSIDLHHADPRNIAVPVTLVSIDSDTLVPPWQMQALAGALGARARLVTISSLYGHDAFLKEVPAISRIIAHALQEGTL